MFERQRRTLGDMARATLLPVLGKYRTCALLDYQSLINPGDALLYRGARTILSESGTDVVYEGCPHTFDASELRRVLPGGSAVVFSGGGNMIDGGKATLLTFRINGLLELTDFPIIQLPQSVFIKDPAMIARFREAANAHPSYTLFVRDEESLSRCESYGVRATLCPDLAMVTTLRRIGKAGNRNVSVIRDDVESASPGAKDAIAGWRHDKWIHTRALRSLAFYALLVIAHVTRATGIKPLSRAAAAATTRYAHWLARANVRYVERSLSRARFVVSDRLHACIASLLLDVPFIAIDNSYGKVHAFLRTWLPDDAATCCATSVEQALEMKEAMEKSPTARRNAA